MRHYPLDRAFLRLATCCPKVSVGNVDKNLKATERLLTDCAKQGVGLAIFPELGLTGYTIGDIVQQNVLLRSAKDGLLDLAHRTEGTQTAVIVGLPIAIDNAIYNCAAVLSGGKIRGIVPKTYLPNYKEFYDKRWYQPWTNENIQIDINGQLVPFGNNLLFKIGPAKVGIEICEDLWVPTPPSLKQAAAGAIIIANPSASPEQVTKDIYRRQLVSLQSAKLVAAYAYAGCDASESTTDIVMGGHQIIAENGVVLAERQALQTGQPVTIADIDLDHLLNDRRRDTNYPANSEFTIIDCQVQPGQKDLRRRLDQTPFIPKGPDTNHSLQRILDIQAQALATRLQNTGISKLVIGLSGGLDSTLALLVAVNACKRLGLKPVNTVQAITMPGQASTKHTQTNAQKLAQALNLEHQVIPINDLAQAEYQALGHDGKTQDTTYENVQARVRTNLLFNRANQINGLVVGTGDLSEIALGWCTYNGDHMSHYNVNASIPKTLVKSLVAYAAKQFPQNVQDILQSILDTPISPELTSSGSGITQNTEAIIGPYELHDFFLYHFVRWNDSPAKIALLTSYAFSGQYSEREIEHWLKVFLSRFVKNQWKRSVTTDGPKVGSVSLSPRGDWRMPSDINEDLWFTNLQQ